MFTSKAIKLLKELKGSNFVPYYNVFKKQKKKKIFYFSTFKIKSKKEDLMKELKKDIKNYCDDLL